MQENIVVKVESRTPAGSNASRRLRNTGKIPAVVYGMELAPFPLAVGERAVENVLKLETGINTIFNLALGEEAAQQRAVMIREIQRDPVSESMIHIDFIRVDLDKEVQVQVPLSLDGEPAGVKDEGGVLDILHRTIHVECLPSAIPDAIHLDISHLNIGDHVSVSDLETPSGTKLLDTEDVVLAVVHAPRAEEPTEVEGDEAETAADAADAPVEGGESDDETTES